MIALIELIAYLGIVILCKAFWTGFLDCRDTTSLPLVLSVFWFITIPVIILTFCLRIPIKKIEEFGYKISNKF